MSTDPKIFVAGHRGMVGSAIMRTLEAQGHKRFVMRTHEEMDLTDQRVVMDFFAQEKPDQVYLAAARVGGIHANNTYPAEFIRDNLAIQTNVIHAAWKHGARKLLLAAGVVAVPSVPPTSAVASRWPTASVAAPGRFAGREAVEILERSRKMGGGFESTSAATTLAPPVVASGSMTISDWPSTRSGRTTRVNRQSCARMTSRIVASCSSTPTSVPAPKSPTNRYVTYSTAARMGKLHTG